MKRKRDNVRKPNAFLYDMVCSFAKPYYHFIYGHSIDKSAIKDIKPPYLVIAGHSSWLDYLITSVTMYPVRMNYVAAFNFFRDRLLKTAFSIMGAISKYQYTNDIGAVKKMKSVIDRGGVVAIFPHGCLSNEGRPGGYAVFGIAKLVKFLNVPVIAVKTDGVYLTRPRWTKSARFGRLETKVTQVLTVSDVENLSEDEIYNKVIEAISFDDYKWQRERMNPYRGRKLAEGLEYVLYKCPKCHSEFTLRSQNSRFFCTNCGNAVKLNKYLLFEPEKADTVYFDGIDKWFDYQKECIDQEIDSPNFRLNARTELKCAEPGKYGYQHLGYGDVSLTREAISYTGLVNGEQKSLIFYLKNIAMVPYAAGEYIEIAKGPDISRFVFEDLRQQIKWVMSLRQIKDNYYEREK